MKSKILLILACSLVCVLAVAQRASAQDATGEVVFCTSFDEKFNPVGAATEFETNQISVFFKAKSGEKFGALEAIVSIYRQNDNGSQTLVARNVAALNPEWNALMIKDMPLPEVGKYEFALTASNGSVYAKGEVTIKEKNVEREIPEEIPMQGVNLAEIFNKYMGLATQQ